MLAIFLELNSKGLHQSSGKEKKVVVFCSRPRQNVRKFHVVVVQQLAEKCTKKRDARAKLLFCLSKPIAYLLFSLRKLTKVTSLAPLRPLWPTQTQGSGHQRSVKHGGLVFGCRLWRTVGIVKVTFH